MNESSFTDKDIYDLEIYEEIRVKSPTTGFHLYDITRVPGGWIFSRADLYAVFVPFINKPKKED